MSGVLWLTFDPDARIDTEQVEVMGAAGAGRAWGAVVVFVLVATLVLVAPICVRFVAALVRDILGGAR